MLRDFIMHTDWLAFTFALSAVTFGAWVQATVGFGYALLSAPLVALVAPSFVPGAIMVSSAVLSLTTALYERSSIDRNGIGLALLGRIPGVILAGVVAKQLGGADLNTVFGVIVLFAVGLSLSGLRLPLTAASFCGAGFVSGLMGTLTSIGGPPMALVYQDAQAPRLRASLNAYFAAGSCMSIAGLHWAGHFGAKQLWDGAALLPGCALGMLLSLPTRGWLAAGRTRQGVLAVATVAALAVVVKSCWQSVS
ncbi:MAG TPA: sulfite exporter TauE/SafE family protein [Polyangiales bacterium]|nr:sulfite exporter TauE/SafE family protein [Polyangiales bacterium]